MRSRRAHVTVAGLWLVFALAGTAPAAEPSPALTDAVRSMLEALNPEAVEPFSSEAGERTWHQAGANGRSCTSCHGETLSARGRHETTGKLIEPMARSVNPERLTERRKIAKWFLRNCKWTYGRECTAQEKGDILVWLSAQ